MKATITVVESQLRQQAVSRLANYELVFEGFKFDRVVDNPQRFDTGE